MITITEHSARRCPAECFFIPTHKDFLIPKTDKNNEIHENFRILSVSSTFFGIKHKTQIPRIERICDILDSEKGEKN